MITIRKVYNFHFLVLYDHQFPLFWKEKSSPDSFHLGVGMILRAKPWNSFFRHNFIDHIIRGGHSVTKKLEDPSITFMEHRSRQETVQATKAITRPLSPHTLVNAVSLPVMALHFCHYSPLS